MNRAKAEEIRRAYFAREANQCELAERFGISQGSVSRIVSGRVWAGNSRASAAGGETPAAGFDNVVSGEHTMTHVNFSMRSSA